MPPLTQESTPTIEATLIQVRTTSRSIRDICDDLHPTYLDDPLSSTLSTSVRHLQAQGPNVLITLTISGTEPPEMRDDTKIACKHVLEEAISNALVHANPTYIHCSLSFDTNGALVLEVVDNGMGFELRPARELLSEGHHGLVNIIERAELVGGDLSVISGPVEGTDIRLQIPSTTVQVA